MMTPSPRSRIGSMGGESPSPAPSQILFTHEEIVVLKLLFSLFDTGGKVNLHMHTSKLYGYLQQYVR